MSEPGIEAVPWPALPDVPDGMHVRRRRDEALAAVITAEDRLAAAETACDEAVRKDREHELLAVSMPSEKWAVRARDLAGAKREAERFQKLAQANRDEAFEDLVAASIALDQQGLHTRCRGFNERLLVAARLGEALEAALSDLDAAIPDKGVRRDLRDALIGWLGTILMRATGYPAAPVPAIEAREFAVKSIAVPNDMMLKRVAENTRLTLQDHWLQSRLSDPGHYKSQRKKRKLGGNGGAEEASPS